MLLILVSAMIAVFASVYKNILGHEPILNWWFKFGLKFENRFFYKPIWGCEKCIAGQMTFWFYVLNWISNSTNGNASFWRFIYFLIPEYVKRDYSVFDGAFCISLTILLTIIISKQLQK